MPRRNQEAEDEAYAQALQDQYRQEFIRRQRRRSNDDGTNIGDGTVNESSSSNHRGDGDRPPRRTSRSHSKGSHHQNRQRRRGSKTGNNSRSRSGSRDRLERRGSNGNGESQRNRRPRRRSGSGRGGYHASDHPQQQQQSQQHSHTSHIMTLPPAYAPNSDVQNARDEEYARMVQAELQREDEEARRVQSLASSGNNHQNQNQYQYTQSHSNNDVEVSLPPTFHRHKDSRHGNQYEHYTLNHSTGSNTTEPMTDDDEAVARRIQQELADAEFAQQISNREREEAASQDVVQSLERQNQIHHQQMLQQQQQQTRRPRSCLCRWAPIVICIALAVTIPLLYVFDVFNAQAIQDVFDDLMGDWSVKREGGGDAPGDLIIDNINGTEIPRLPPDAFGWPNTGTGLRLDVLDATGSVYKPFVQTALANWEDGYPIDSLSFRIQEIPYEYKCSSEEGKLKICNGDYGDNRWRGLNEVILLPRRNTIVMSSAKLNEFYLGYESDAQKLYTACHELGHGFGLPHWDEDFFNKDLGNCMDYTQNPHKQATPDESNFLYLAQLYGGTDVRTNTEMTAAEAQSIAFADETVTNNARPDRGGGLNLGGLNQGRGGDDEKGIINLGGNNRRRERSLLRSYDHGGIPHSQSRLLRDPSDHPMALPGGVPHSERRVLLANPKAELHEFESPDFPGMIVRQQFLLVEDSLEEYRIRTHKLVRKSQRPEAPVPP